MTPEAQEALQKQKWASRLEVLGLPGFEYPTYMGDEQRQQFFERIMKQYHRAPEPGDPGFSVDTGTGLGLDRAPGAGTPYGLFDEIGLERADPSEVKNLGKETTKKMFPFMLRVTYPKVLIIKEK